MDDFYCEQALSGKTAIKKIIETDNVLAYYHTKPYWPIHIVVVPKKHIDSLLTLTDEENTILLELIKVIKQIASEVTQKHGACRILTNLGKYQDSKHLHFHLSFGPPKTGRP